MDIHFEKKASPLRGMVVKQRLILRNMME